MSVNLQLVSFLKLGYYGQKPQGGTQVVFRYISHSAINFLSSASSVRKIHHPPNSLDWE